MTRLAAPTRVGTLSSPSRWRSHIPSAAWSLERVPLAAALFVGIVATTVVLTWTIGADVPSLRRMPLDAALAFVLLAVAVGAWARASDRPALPLLMTGLAAAIAAAELMQYLTGVRRGGGSPIGMSPVTATAILVLAASSASLYSRYRTPVALTGAGLAAAVSLLALLTTAFGASPPAFLTDATVMSVPSAVVTLALSVGVIGLLPHGGPLRILAGGTPATRLARRLLAAAILVPIVIGWLRLWGEQAGLYDTAYGVGLSLATTIVLLVAVVIRAGMEALRAEQASAEAQEERDRFFDLSSDLLAVADADGRFVRLNPAWETTLGYPRGELLGREFLDLVHPDDRAATVEETRRLFEHGKRSVRFQNRYRDHAGSYRWLEWSSRSPSANGLVYAVARDVTAQKLEQERLLRRAARLARRNERLSDSAVRDPLTGLYNRRHFDERFPRLIDRARRRGGGGGGTPAAILFDLDHFGQLNKQFGHQAGDAVLRRFSDLLRERFRRTDLVARYGGEEFAVVLEDTTIETAKEAAAWIRERLAAEPILFDGQALRATVSAGCAAWHPDGSDHELLTTADVALVLAKRAGRNTVVQL